MGTLKEQMKTAHVDGNLPSNAENVTVNRAGGVAFEIEDSALKLVTMTGGSFFAEPRYYSAPEITCTEPSKLQTRIEIQGNEVKEFTNINLDDVAIEIIHTAIAIAKSETPEDLLVIAAWLRIKMNIRLTPQVLLVIASRCESTKGFVRKYAPYIIKRPDEIKTCMAVHKFFFGNKTFSNQFMRALQDSLSKLKEENFLKYDTPEYPTWKNVLQWIPRRKGFPVNQAIADYFIKDKVSDAKQTPVIAARKELVKHTTLSAEAITIAKRARVTWEFLISHFKDDKKSAWRFLIAENMLGYMALMRNVRNILDADVGQDYIETVTSKLTNKDAVLKSKQLPFRFYSAWKVIHQGMTYDNPHKSVLEAIEDAAKIACENIPVIPGTTAIFADNSGSMTMTVSDKSTVSCADAANILCGIAALRCEHAYVYAFGTAPASVRYTRNDTPITIAKNVDEADTRGMATNGHLCIREVIDNIPNVDRIIILSDMQCWNDSYWGVRRGDTMANEWKKLHQHNKGCWLHSVHLNGYGDTPIDVQDKVNLVGGFSEKIFQILLTAEGVATETEDEPQVVTTLEQIRDEFSLNLA